MTTLPLSWTAAARLRRALLASACLLLAAACEKEAVVSKVEFPDGRAERGKHCMLVLRHDMNKTAEEYAYSREAAANASRQTRDALKNAWADAREGVLETDTDVRKYFGYLNNTFDLDHNGNMNGKKEQRELARHVRLCQQAYSG